MDTKIKKIIELCGYEDDPSWDVMKRLFYRVTFEDYHKILDNRDNLVKDILEKNEARVIQSTDDFLAYVESDGRKLIAKEPLFVAYEVSVPDHRVATKAPFYLGEGASIADSIIYSPCYVGDGAEVQHSRIVSDRFSYIGDNAKVSHLEELRGCFISGGPLRDEGREKTYMHARSLNNTIVGAYSGISVGTDVYNHPLMGEKALKFDPETRNLIESDERKLPILVGLEASIGAHCLINSGAVVRAGARVPSRTDVIGYQR